MSAATRNRLIAAVLLVIALALLGLGVFYATQDTTFLASPPARIQGKHAILSFVLAVLALIAASVVWRAGRRRA